ncbi:MAG: acyl carrier protein [Lentisphaerae bacterium]|nr:MAG: acyl carrier protein [Lentisphaerota bacterium]
MDLKETLKQALIDEFELEDLKPEDIADDTSLFGDDGLGLDSLDAVEMVVLIRKKFGVEVPNMEEGMKAFETIGSLAAYIEEKQKEKDD